MDWNIAYLPFIAIAAVVWFETVRLMKGHRAAQLLFAAGIAGWLVAAVFDAARTGRAEALAGGRAAGDGIGAACCCWACSPFARACSLAEHPAPQTSRESDRGDRARGRQQGGHPRRW